MHKKKFLYKPSCSKYNTRVRVYNLTPPARLSDVHWQPDVVYAPHWLNATQGIDFKLAVLYQWRTISSRPTVSVLPCRRTLPAGGLFRNPMSSIRSASSPSLIVRGTPLLTVSDRAFCGHRSSSHQEWSRLGLHHHRLPFLAASKRRLFSMHSVKVK